MKIEKTKIERGKKKKKKTVIFSFSSSSSSCTFAAVGSSDSFGCQYQKKSNKNWKK